MKAIFIDAGHGFGADGTTPDNGASGIVQERETVVAIAKEVIALLARQPMASRNMIYGIAVDERLSLMNHIRKVNEICGLNGHTMASAILVSIHCNKAAPSASGGEGWYEGGNTNSQQLCTTVTGAMCSQMELKNRGAKSDLTNQDGRLGIVRDVIPTACLLECGFVSNTADAAKLKKAAEFAKGIVKGICAHLGEEYVETPAGIFPDVEAGRWSEDEIAFVKGKGWMTGYGDGTFKPTQPVSREELAVILSRIHQ